ncbi:MAG: FGGY family carbohydrate kinase [Lachnospiraceae bacterium]|nr:FGGY family carbohydrate kinase [Lachnospiraceae bacterium]
MKIIGIDIGTTSISSVVLDEETKIQVAAKTLPNDTAISGQDWERMQDADRILEKCTSLVAEYRKAWPDVRRIGITGQMHGMLYVDENGCAISPLTTWEDERGNQTYREGSTYAQELRARSGYAMATGYGLTTHFYNVQNHLVPEQAASLTTIMDYVAMRLTGSRHPMTHPTNAASFGLFDIRRGSFDERACRKAGIDPAILPEVVRGEEVIGRTEDGIEVMIPIGDNQAGILGLCESEQDIVLNIGTSSQISKISEAIPEDQTLECRPYVGGKYLLLGAGLCGGTSFRMLNDFFCDVCARCKDTVSRDEMFGYMMAAANEAREAEQGMEALNVRTLFRGTRANPSLRGSIDGITMTNLTMGTLVLGFYRGVLMELHEAYQKMDVDPEQGRLLLCGNALRNNPLLRKLCAELFGRDACLTDKKEETATGAALLAMRTK